MKPRTERFAGVRRLLKGYDLTGARLGAVIGKSDFTGNSRLKNPGDLTLNELFMICHNGRVPAEEIKEALKFND